MNGMKFTSTEVTLGRQLSHVHTIKINSVKRFFKTQEKFESEYTEIFPGKKFAFWINILPVGKYTRYKISDSQPWTDITENDKFLSLYLKSQNHCTTRLAGQVEITLGDIKQSFSFGDHLNDKYLKFDYNTFLWPGKIVNICEEEIHYDDPKLATTLVPVRLTEDGADTLEVKFTLYYEGDVTQTQGRSMPDSLKVSNYLSAQNVKIMKDQSTADLKITCGERDNKKIFNVHKSFFCASSPVFRAAIETDMVEGRTNEIYIEEEEVEKSVEEMIHYVYTGDFAGADDDLDVQSVAWLGDKYNLPGMMELLCSKMSRLRVAGPEKVADILIAAERHDSEDLKMAAIQKLRYKKEMVRNPAFKRKLKDNQMQDLVFDLLEIL